MQNLSKKIRDAWKNPPESGISPLFERLLEELSNRGISARAGYASVLNEYGSYLRVNGLYTYGAEIYQRALAAIEALDGRHTPYAVCLSNYAELCRLNGDYDACASMLAEARSLYADNNSVEYAANLNYQAHLLESMGRGDDALEAQAQSLAIIAEKEPESPNLACAHQNLGTAYSAQGEYEKALVELSEAERIYKALRIETNAHVVSLFNSLGNLYEMQGNQFEARAAYERALKLMETCKMNPDEAELVKRNAIRFLEQPDNGAA